ncbi:DUF2300 domain-containing protein, partial [Paraburkholderia sp. Cy-641]|uniref:DUF2300 domain-containing protein n=1 Tax=Paraburkholderia sp. Cy-641 TaxID=2608337 RepID=UPI001423C74D
MRGARWRIGAWWAARLRGGGAAVCEARAGGVYRGRNAGAALAAATGLPSAALALRSALATLALAVAPVSASAAALPSSSLTLAAHDRPASHGSSSSSASTAATPLRFAWLRDNQPQLWQTDASGTAPALSPQAAQALPATLETPLGSVWKLFVYGYLVDRHIATPDYVCNGGDRDEVYCCMTGGHVDREHALVQSCGLYFEPARLQLDSADWRRYWSAAHAP